MDSSNAHSQTQWLSKRFGEQTMDSMSSDGKSKKSTISLKIMNACGILYFLIVTCMIVITSYCVTLPAIYSGFGLWARGLVGIVILFQIVANFFFIWSRRSICKDSPSTTSALPSVNWHMCVDCRRLAPPRSHHCPLCRNCIAQRDHHCFFTASCIGRDNRRHFVAFCLDCSLGTGYASWVAFHYMSAHYNAGDGLARLVLPIALVRWMLAWETMSFMIFLCFLYICAMSCFASFGIAVWQAFLIMRGQTSYDFNSYSSGKVRVTPRSLVRNVRSVCGPYWPVVFLVPWPVFPLPDNGDAGYTKIL